MKIEQSDYIQKLIEVYQATCNTLIQEKISLQAQLDLVLKEVEKLENTITELEYKVQTHIDEVIDVNQNIDS